MSTQNDVSASRMHPNKRADFILGYRIPKPWPR